MKKIVSFIVSIFLTSCICIMPVYASHSYEITMTEELSKIYLSRENAFQNEDGVFYSPQLYGEFEFEPIETSIGCFDRSPLLLALLKQYPNAKFGVQIGCSYGTDLNAEIIRLDSQGIKASLDEKTGRLVTILNATQLEDFPASDKIGYQIGLAQSPTLSSNLKNPKYGDVNCDNTIDIMDVIHINKYLLGNEKLTTSQLASADCNQDGIIDEVDSLDILKYIVGIIDTL